MNESFGCSHNLRKCKIIYFLEDDTIKVVEPVVINSGLPQGTCNRSIGFLVLKKINEARRQYVVFSRNERVEGFYFRPDLLTRIRARNLQLSYGLAISRFDNRNQCICKQSFHATCRPQNGLFDKRSSVIQPLSRASVYELKKNTMGKVVVYV